MGLVHPVYEVDHLNRNLSITQLLVDYLFLRLNLLNFVLSQRGVSLSQIESTVQFLERNHAKFFLHQIVDKQTQLLVSQLILQLHTLLLECTGEIFGLHSCVTSVAPVLVNHLVRSLVLRLQIAADH